MVWSAKHESMLNEGLVAKVNERTKVCDIRSINSNKLNRQIKALSKQINAIAAALEQKDINYIVESGVFDDCELEEFTGVKQSLFVD